MLKTHYKTLLNKNIMYKDILCKIVKVPDPPVYNALLIYPGRCDQNIGNGNGRSVELSPLEFEVEVFQSVTL